MKTKTSIPEKANAGQKQRSICVGYAYATSPTATKLGFRNGCWYVVEMIGTREQRGERGFTDKGEAIAHARQTGLPFNRFSTI